MTAYRTDRRATDRDRAPSEATLLSCAAVLFDCDGVLVDSEATILRSWNQWARQMGVDPGAVTPTIHGRRSRDTVAEFVEPERHAEGLALIDRIEIDAADEVTPIPGAVELLRSIPADRWAIVTSGSRALAQARVTAVGLPLPEVLITADDVVHGKPHPEGYLAAAAGLGVPATDCLVLEDAVAGVRAARAANVRSVLGVGDGDFGDAEPTLTIPDLRVVRWTSDGLEVRSTGSR
ncbi:MAG: HAD-IA family hydrolase [Micropruina sp.]|nr:HAD-IA family hydrolase [Micropruina sp.]